MTKIYKDQKTEDISGFHLTNYAFEKFIIDSGIADVIQARGILQILFKKAKLYKKSKNSIYFKNKCWRFVVKTKAKRPDIVTIYKVGIR